MDRTSSFGYWLRRRRKALDLTQAELAQRVSCAAITIRKIEADELRPSAQVVERLAECLALPAAERAAFIKAARAELAVDRLALTTQPVEPALAAPSGTITFLFTDIEGSTTLWEQHAQAMPAALARHDALMQASVAAHGGVVFKTAGDSILAAFAQAPDALAAALAAQRAFVIESWALPEPLRVRMALHTGSAEVRGDDYFGPTLNRAARLLDAGHGGQVLLSLATEELVREQLPPDAALRDLGTQRLKDLSLPEQIFQLIAPDLPATFPALNTLDARRTNLPAQPTSLIGREQEVAAVCALLQRADVRLLTLTGPGGIGKTRLGVQVAAELLDDFGDGVYFVDLAPIREPHLVISAMAQTLGIRETGGQPLLTQLKQFLGSKRMLLLLDNFEQLLDAAPLVAELLATMGELKVLVTSRERLHLRGEKEVAVPPLALPDCAQLPPLEVLSQYAAVALFIQRALDARADFEVTNANAAAVAEICARLDGLPLAIELAAASSKMFDPTALLARLRSRLTLLGGGARDLPARQRTLRATLDWSYHLLTAAEQTLFRRLAVFAGGCTLEAATAVCNVNSDLPMDVIDGIAGLLDQSLLRREEGADGEPRVVMLETIREYALERLDMSGETETLWQQHAAYLLALAERAIAEFSSSEQLVRWGRMDAEYANLRAALRWAAERGAIETGVRLAIMWEWVWRSHVIEGRMWCDAFLQQRSNLPIALRAKALKEAGYLATIQGDYPRAQVLLAESLALARELGDKQVIATALDVLGFTATAQGDYRQAQELLEESARLSQELGDTLHIAITLIRLGDVVSLQGDYARAVALCQESLTLAQERDDTLLVGLAFYSLGTLAQRQGDAGQARALLAKSLPVFQEAGDMESIAAYLERMAEIAGIEGQPERLVRLFGAAVSLHTRLGMSPDPAEQAAYERQLLAARAQLGEQAFATAWEAGRALRVEQAITEAVDDAAEAPIT